jgi:hypothetical protein
MIRLAPLNEGLRDTRDVAVTVRAEVEGWNAIVEKLVPASLLEPRPARAG